jgi:hypothetical protein
VTAYSFYDPKTGALTGATFYSSNPAHLALNTPAGLAVVEGEWSAERYAVDLATGAVVPRRDAPPPDPEKRRRDLLVQIAHLEARQMRPLRELAIDPHDRGARERVTAIDEQIAALRAQLT